MITRKDKEQKEIAGALGASKVIRLKGRRSRGPLGWIELAQTLQSRLVSRGGRPSDPHWDTKRLVPFRHQIWERLAAEAEAISEHGRKVGPAQLAAILIEEKLASRKGRNLNI